MMKLKKGLANGYENTYEIAGYLILVDNCEGEKRVNITGRSDREWIVYPIPLAHRQTHQVWSSRSR